MEQRLKVGDVVKNFKRETVDQTTPNYLYIINDMDTYHTETGERLVIYQSMYTDKNGKPMKFARPYDMFMSEVDHDKYPDIKQKYRFEKVDF